MTERESPTNNGMKRPREPTTSRSLDLKELFFPSTPIDGRSPAPKLIKREPSEPLGFIQGPGSSLSEFDVLTPTKGVNKPQGSFSIRTDIFVKTELESSYSDVSDSASEEEAEGPTSSNGSNNCVPTNFQPLQPPRLIAEPLREKHQAQDNLVSFGPGVFFRSTPAVGRPAGTNRNVGHGRSLLFCVHCKEYGHQRANCRNPWKHWWPHSFLNRFPWLKRKVHDIRRLRHKGQINEYRKAMNKLETEAEVADRKMQGANHNGRSPYQNPPLPLAESGQNNRQNFLHARRRCAPFQPTKLPPSTTSQSECCTNPSCKFNFDCKSLIVDLQMQIAALRVSLLGQSKENSSTTLKENNGQVIIPHSAREAPQSPRGREWFKMI